jgi:cytochrome c oxidase subunit 2
MRSAAPTPPARSGPTSPNLASRGSLAAGVLPNGPAALRRWLAEAETIKPGSKMPSFGMLPPDQLDAIVAYLGGLE